MPRIRRITAVEIPHHITQRGNYRQTVFKSSSDREKYLEWINEYSQKYQLEIIAYCLMSNHVHLIVIPHQTDSLAKTFNMAHMRYAQFINRRNKTSGHLWQGRFYSCMLDDIHLMEAVRYVERNPVRSGLIKKPWEWKWSSAIEHTENIDKNKSILKLSEITKYIEMNKEEWKNFLNEKEDKEKIGTIKKHTLTGKPFGTEKFIRNNEKRFGINLIIKGRGRPKKK
ncbi:MAG: hypothetical protein A2539_08410 [Elusimicrobia bacterium RIFOXYD2_FULL_34_15]|nr:MAG: hypothetical protein A2539_08410 [Elusimicrobia bacterium RIFOXYD2_FULL_34_15]